MNEAELIKRCINKEKRAWDIFVERYAKLIYWAIKKRFNMSSFTFSDFDAQNVFQEVFLSLLENEKLIQLRDARLISAWLVMVASNKAIDFMREKIRLNQRLVADPVLSKDEESSKSLFNREITDIVKNLINTLSGREKIIISLNLFEEKTHKEIANILSMPVNTVSTIISRTKEKLKKELERRGIK